MKGFLMRLAIWVAIGLAMLAVIPEAVAPQKDSTSYDLALLDLAEAYKSKSPEAMARTVFAFGGSQLAYGLDSAQFAEAGLELANLGLNVGVGLAYPMHLIDWIRTALPHSTPPAAILISPAATHFIDENQYTEYLPNLLAAVPGGARWAWACDGLPLWLEVKARAGRVWSEYFTQQLNRPPHQRDQPIVGNLHRDILTGAGTIDEQWLILDTLPKSLKKVHPFKRAVQAPRTLAWLRKQNVPIFVLPPALPEPDVEVCKSLNVAYENFTNACGDKASLLLKYPQGSFPTTHFIDRAHLNPKGRALWTRQIIDALTDSTRKSH
jgi:hypothetical protein